MQGSKRERLYLLESTEDHRIPTDRQCSKRDPIKAVLEKVSKKIRRYGNREGECDCSKV